MKLSFNQHLSQSHLAMAHGSKQQFDQDNVMSYPCYESNITWVFMR